MVDTQTHTHTGYGIEYANGDREWHDHAESRDMEFERDERMARKYPEDDALPVAKLKREVTTTLTITREVA
jgi:hypothetical protein